MEVKKNMKKRLIILKNIKFEIDLDFSANFTVA